MDGEERVTWHIKEEMEKGGNGVKEGVESRIAKKEKRVKASKSQCEECAGREWTTLSKK